MSHQLGYAKPLGFGSVKVTVDRLASVNWGERLRSLEENAGWKESPRTKVNELKAEFRQTMVELYPDEFKAVLADLLAILGGPPELPIHYPRPTQHTDPAYPSFEWFVGNKRRVQEMGRGQLPDPETLALASEDSEGLRLIRKDGTQES